MEASRRLRERLGREPRELLEVFLLEGVRYAYDPRVFARDRVRDGAQGAKGGRHRHRQRAWREGGRQAEEGRETFEVRGDERHEMRVVPSVGVRRNYVVGARDGEKKPEELHPIDLVESSAENGCRHLSRHLGVKANLRLGDGLERGRGPRGESRRSPVRDKGVRDQLMADVAGGGLVAVVEEVNRPGQGLGEGKEPLELVPYNCGPKSQLARAEH